MNISALRENYDTSNPIIAEILKAKEERFKILLELNRKSEEELGLKGHFSDEFNEKKKLRTKKKRASEINASEISLRRSTRLLNTPITKYREIDGHKLEPVKNNFNRPPLDYGKVPGVEVGCYWETRLECSRDGVHRPTVAGIHAGPDGAYSIALSGGYPEDVDEGDTFIYTGAGGRDLSGSAKKPKNLRVAPQTKDQVLLGSNLSLAKNIETKMPVRVIRGYKSPSIYAPETGYRYDGLYQVVSFWEDIGQTGFRVYRFKMERLKDQTPAPWEAGYTTFKRKTLGGSYEEIFQEFFESDETEFKENIAPADRIASLDKISDQINDVDGEIKKCIDFVSKAATEEFAESNEEDFYGWD